MRVHAAVHQHQDGHGPTFGYFSLPVIVAFCRLGFFERFALARTRLVSFCCGILHVVEDLGQPFERTSSWSGCGVRHCSRRWPWGACQCALITMIAMIDVDILLAVMVQFGIERSVIFGPVIHSSRSRCYSDRCKCGFYLCQTFHQSTSHHGETPGMLYILALKPRNVPELPHTRLWVASLLRFRLRPEVVHGGRRYRQIHRGEEQP